MKTEPIDKKVVNPFEFTIMTIADPERAVNYRAETDAEKSVRLTEKFTDFAKRIKIIKS